MAAGHFVAKEFTYDFSSSLADQSSAHASFFLQFKNHF
jgi:hypothetical protein